MTIPRPRAQGLSIEGYDIANLDARLKVVETTDPDAPTTLVFNKRLGSRGKLATQLKNLNDRLTALEIDATKPVDFNTTFLSRSPLETALLNLHKRLLALSA